MSGRTSEAIGTASIAAALSALLTVALVGCTAPGETQLMPTPVLSAGSGGRLGEAARAAMAEELKRSVSCDDGDELFDDLSFWDGMRGWDCYDTDSVFIRVYEHAESVPWALTEIDESFGADRTVVRGEHWYVVGPPAVVHAVRPPASEPVLPYAKNQAGDGPNTEDYVSTCTIHGADEAKRIVRGAGATPAEAMRYAEVFPGVFEEVRSAMKEIDTAAIRRIQDRERWSAALSRIGPRVKAVCWEDLRARSDAR